MVKEQIVNFGTVKEGASIEISWDLTVDPSEIVHFAPDCGCTANIRVDKESKQIKATYTEDDAKGLTMEQKTDWYPTGKIPISKGITVYLRDDQNLVVLNDNNETIFNTAKRQERIGFVGECEYNK